MTYLGIGIWVTLAFIGVWLFKREDRHYGGTPFGDEVERWLHEQSRMP